MLNQFSRTQLLLGKDGIERLLRQDVDPEITVERA